MFILIYFCFVFVLWHPTIGLTKCNFKWNKLVRDTARSKDVQPSGDNLCVSHIWLFLFYFCFTNSCRKFKGIGKWYEPVYYLLFFISGIIFAGSATWIFLIDRAPADPLFWFTGLIRLFIDKHICKFMIYILFLEVLEDEYSGVTLSKQS